MKPVPIDKLVHQQMFPKPKPNDPSNFHALLHRSLIPEVRQETHAFYGHLDTQEAKYPGLDYSHPTHRIRLSRFPWHRRLFRAFDALHLTPAEIAGLTKWEGTKWAKEKFEREQGVTIRDTTADGFPDWVEPEDRPSSGRPQPHSQTLRSRVGEADNEDVIEDEDEDMDDDEEEFVEVLSDDEIDSVGVELNQRLLAQAARRDAGESSVVLDEEWEQWFKNAMETGQLSYLSDEINSRLLRAGNSSAVLPARVFPPEMISAARAGRWSDVPDFLHDVLRRTLEAENPHRRPVGRDPETGGESGSSSRATSARATPAPTSVSRLQTEISGAPQSSLNHYVDNLIFGPWPRRSVSELRLPVGEAGSGQRATGAPGA
ncbi:hypothetical protein NLU13_1314 [Sarocladium strictum]|uniref:Uncharacterized protein n=1 Tax=Sarocladium strictum TaxID=5046 RepID=A0AA39GQR2_SARSR|nr:hypothetical protein NLU13_1314 [Sarocladium strictum]